MGKKLRDLLETLPPEKQAELLRRVEEKKKQQAAAKDYRNITEIQGKAQTFQQTGANFVQGLKEEMLSGIELDPFSAALAGINPRSVEDVQGMQEQVAVQGTANIGHEGGEPARYGTDIEGARKRHPRALVTARGDQYAVIDRSTGELLATRDEYPPLWEHMKRLGSGGDATYLGVAGNALSGYSRVPATALTYLGDATSKDPRAREGMSLRQFGSDLVDAFVNEKGQTVAEGGRVSVRGAGFGDTLRRSAQRILAENPNATTMDLLGVMGVTPSTDSDWTVSLRRRLDSYVDEDFDFLGEAIGIFDPVGNRALDATGRVIKKVAAPAAKRVVKTGKAVLPKVAVDALGKARDVAKTDVGQWARETFGAPVSARVLAEGLERTHGAAAGELAQQVEEAARIARAETAIAGKETIEHLRDVAGQVTKKEADQVLPIVESLRDVDDGEAIVRLREKLDSGESIAPSGLAGSEDLARAKRIRELTDEQMETLSRTDEAIAEQIQKEEAAFTAFLRDSNDAMLQQLAKGDEKALSELSAIRRIARKRALEPAELARAQKHIPIQWQGPAWRKAKADLIEELDDVHLARFHLADQYGIDLFRKLEMPGVSDELMGAAKKAALKLRKEFTDQQRFGYIDRRARPGGYAPHVPRKGVLGTEPRAYNPRGRRYAVATANLADLRNAAFKLTQDPQAMSVLTEAEAKLVKKFASNPNFQVRNLEKMQAFFTDVDNRVQATIEQVTSPEFLERSAQLGHSEEKIRELVDTLDEGAATIADVKPTPRKDVTDEARKAIEQRTGQSVTTERDPIKALATYYQQMQAGNARGRLGLRLEEIEVNGRKLAEDPVALVDRYGSDELKARMLEKLPSGAVQMRQGQFAGVAGRFKGGKEVAHGIALDPAVLGLMREHGWTYVGKGSTIAQKLPMLEGKALPSAILPEIERMAGRMETSAAERFFGLLGKVNRLWIPLVINTPGFHIRNFLYGEFQVYLAIGDQAANPALMRRAFEVAAAAEGGLATDAVMKIGKRNYRVADLALEARRRGVVETGLVAEIERISERTASYADQRWKEIGQRFNPWSPKGLVGEESIFKALGSRLPAKLMGGIWKKGSATAENLQRMRVFLGRLEMGDSLTEAANMTSKYLFDYTGSGLWGIEKSLRKVFPFYQWLRYSSAQTIEEMLKQPKKFKQVNHLFQMMQASAGRQVDDDGKELPFPITASDPAEIPRHLAERGAVYLPEALANLVGAKQTQGKKWMMALERPGAALDFLGPLFEQDPLRFASDNLFPQMGVSSRVPVELATGKYAFGGMPIDDRFDPEDRQNNALERALHMRTEAMPGYFVGTLGGPWLSMLAAALNMPRNPKTPGGDEDERLKFQGMSALLGPRIAPFKPAQVFSQRVRETSQRYEGRRRTDRREAQARNKDISPLDRLLLRLMEGQ